VIRDCVSQVRGPAIVHKEQALAQSPQRRCAELIAARRPLGYSIIKPAHAVYGKVGIGMVIHAAQRDIRRRPRQQRRTMT